MSALVTLDTQTPNFNTNLQSTTSSCSSNNHSNSVSNKQQIRTNKSKQGKCVGSVLACKKPAAQKHSGICMSYRGCKWEGNLTPKKKRGGRRKRKRTRRKKKKKRRCTKKKR